VSEDLTPIEASGSFAAEPQAVSAARGLVAQVLEAAGIDEERGADALLVASELVANAIHHGSGFNAAERSCRAVCTAPAWAQIGQASPRFRS
jgi:anti-sigma regulatory factor (Ser/Thr protein kinase)